MSKHEILAVVLVALTAFAAQFGKGIAKIVVDLFRPTPKKRPRRKRREQKRHH